MSSYACERCGGDGPVTVTHRRSDRHPPEPQVFHHYCRACAKLLGVPLLDRKALPPDIADGLGIWSDIETMVAYIDRDIPTSLATGGIAAKAATQLVETCQDLPGPVPARIREALARIGLPIDPAAR